MLRRLVLLLLLLVSVKAESQRWLIDYPSGETEEVNFIGGDVSGEYNYSVGYKYDRFKCMIKPIALCIDGEGSYKDKVYHEIEKGYFCYALRLGCGEVFVVALCGAGVEDEVYDSLWFAIINTNLEVMKEEYVKIEAPYFSYGNTIHALENDNDEIIVVTQVTDDIQSEVNYNYDYAFYKVDNDCELLECSYLKNSSCYADISDFAIVPNTNLYAVFGNGMNPNNLETVFYIDDDLEYVTFDFIEDFDEYPNLLRPKFMCVDRWTDDGLLMSVQSTQTKGVNEWCPMVLKMDSDMNVVDVLNLERYDTTDYVSQYRSMLYVDSTTIYISTFWYRGRLDGILPKNHATIYLINDNMELLGRKTLEMTHFFNVLYIQATSDRGCLVQGYVDDGEQKRAVICKLAKSDFEIAVNVCDVSFSDVNVYPNPVSSLLNIDVCDNEGKSVKVEIYDMLGRRYLDKDVVLNGNTIMLDVSPFPDGMYVYRVEYGEDSVVEDVFIKE